MKLQKNWYGLVTTDAKGFKELMSDCDFGGPVLFKTKKAAEHEGRSAVSYSEVNSKDRDITKVTPIKVTVQIV